MSFERNYQIRILSKQRNIQIIRLYFTKVQESFIEKPNLSPLGGINPWFLTGFVDGEGCFLININRNEELKIDWNVQLCFQIGLHRKDKSLLEQIKKYFNVGSITKQGSESYQYRVSSVKDLNIIINHFNNYPLITQKSVDYKLFKMAFYIIQKKKHLTQKGLTKIVAIKGSLNLGLSPELKVAFPETIIVKRPLVLDKKISELNWLAGFSSAEKFGCFFINLHKVTDRKLNERVKLGFKLTQHISPPPPPARGEGRGPAGPHRGPPAGDEQLMKSLIELLVPSPPQPPLEWRYGGRGPALGPQTPRRAVVIWLVPSPP